MNMLREVVAVAAALVCCATGSALAEDVGSQATSSTSAVQGLEAASTPASGAPDKSGAAAPAPKPRVNYVLGAIVSSSPDYAGGTERSYGLRPAWALEYGRFRLSTSRGNALMGHGLTAQSESGASAMLAQSERFSLRASLRIDQGDDGSDSPRRRGLPEVRSTLRARLSTGYALTPRWSVVQGFRKTFWGVTVVP